MSFKEFLNEGVDLKSKAAQLEDMINDDNDYVNIIGLTIDGSIGGERVYRHILDTVDSSKKNYGKRGSNLVAYVGSLAIQEMSGVKANQALSVYKYLSKQAQEKFNAEIKDQLESAEADNAE
jgi:hypothetical protein